MSTKINAEQLDAVASEFEVAGVGLRQLSIKAGGVSEGKLGFSWKVVEVLASAFSFSATRSTFTLGTAASSNANVTDYATLVKNGLDSQSLTVTTAAADEFSLSGTTLSVHGDITASGAAYKLRYIVGTESGAGASSGNTLWSGTFPQDPLEAQTDYFTDSTLDPKWTEWDPQAKLSVEENADGLKLTRVSGGAIYNGLTQDIPAGVDFCATVEVEMDMELGKNVGIGIIVGEDLVTNPTTDAFYQCTLLWGITDSTLVLSFDRRANYNAGGTSTFTDAAGSMFSKVYLRLFVDNTGSTIQGLVSRDGRRWLAMGAAVSTSGDTLDQMGFVVLNVSGDDAIFYSSMFRVDLTSDPYLPVGAKIGTGGGGGGGGGSAPGPYASPPASPSEGQIYVTDDGPLHRIWDSSGWVDYFPGAGVISTTPTTGWTLLNSATVSTVGGVTQINGAGAGGGANPPSAHRAAPAAPYTVVMAAGRTMQTVFRPGFYHIASDDAIVLLEDGRIVLYTSWSTTWTGSLTIIVGTVLRDVEGYGGLYYVQLEDDNTDLYIRVGASKNGPWSQVYKEGRSFRMTAPDAIVIGVDVSTVPLPHYGEA